MVHDLVGIDKKPVFWPVAQLFAVLSVRRPSSDRILQDSGIGRRVNGPQFALESVARARQRTCQRSPTARRRMPNECREAAFLRSAPAADPFEREPRSASKGSKSAYRECLP